MNNINITRPGHEESNYISTMRLFPEYRPNYVETHYRFKAGFTLLSRKAPEILFDAPFRIDPGQPLTAILIIKDAHRYPVELLKITAAIGLLSKHRIFMREIAPNAIRIDTELYYQLMSFPLPDDYCGQVRLTFKLDLKINNKITFVLNDNIPFASHADYAVNVSGHALPALPGYVYGETHFHSHLTRDQVEYGIPLKAVSALALPMGLKYAFATDHSYDLDSRNPFNKSKDAFAELRESAGKQAQDFILVPGEEVSVRNRKGKTVHLCAINHPGFFKGYGDCGRSLMKTGCEHSIREVAEACAAQPDTLTFAAHPGFKESFLERILLGRGHWDLKDYPEELKASQFWNGETDKTFFRGRKDWITLLLSGRKIFCLGGNDAHGDFNRTRKIGFPFLSISEGTHHRFGNVRTAVKPEEFTAKGIIQAIRKGRAVITNGPFARLAIQDDNQEYASGDTITKKTITLTIKALSTPEFGPLVNITLLRGEIGAREEKMAVIKPRENEQMDYSTGIETNISKYSYVRLEVTSATDKNVFYAYTNPIWINPGEV